MNCPNCGKEVSQQYDTQAEEPFFHCFNCEQSYTIEMTPAYHMTSVEEQ